MDAPGGEESRKVDKQGNASLKMGIRRTGWGEGFFRPGGKGENEMVNKTKKNGGEGVSYRGKKNIEKLL